MQKKGLFTFVKDVRQLVLVSLFISMYVVLSMFNIYLTREIRLSFTFVPVAWSAAAFGPVAGMLTGAFGDVLSWFILKPAPYHPGLTISGIVSGLIYGLMMYKKPFSLVRTVITSLVYVLVVEVLMNTLWLSQLYGTPYLILLGGRGLKAAFSFALQILVLSGTEYYLKRIAAPRMKGV